MQLVEQILFFVHGMSAAAWFGAIFYRTLIVDGKAVNYFPERADYERFSTHLAHGMRYVVIAGIATCGLSGALLAGLRWDRGDGVWLGFMAAKLLLWLAACVLFIYVSWVHWPRRALALPVEYTGFRRQGVVLAGGMVLLTGIGFLLGQACRLTL